jgi:hypothetical protein
MGEVVVRLLYSQHPWSSIFYLVVGVVLGAVVSIYLTFRAQRPNLQVVGTGGGGGEQDGCHWSVTIMNRPSFFGTPLQGETAKEIVPWLQPKQRKSTSYPLYWYASPPSNRIDVEPGQQFSLPLFFWTKALSGYCVCDSNRVPIAKFTDRNRKFTLAFNDRLGRTSKTTLIVNFDDSNLQTPPQLQIIYPLTFEARGIYIRSGLRRIATGIGFR